MAPQNFVSINNSEELGKLIRAARKWQRLNQDEVGRFSHSFIGEVEAGKPTAQVGKVLEALRELGIRIHLELPAGMPPPAGTSPPTGVPPPADTSPPAGMPPPAT